MLRRTFVGVAAGLLAGTANAQPVGQVSRFFTTPYVTEGQYLESSILMDIASMLVYARTGKAAGVEVACEMDAAGKTVYRLTLPGNTLTVSFTGTSPIWEPARYEAVVTRIATTLGLARPKPETKPEGNPLQELANPRLETLAGLSQHLSRRLGEQMLDRNAHEQAALLLAAFALRERLEPFDDQRWALNRLTAHLALSRWLSEAKPGLPARYALATAYALMNLQTNALARVRELEQDPQGDARWNRALYARITADYRTLTALPADQLSLLEWAERINATSKSVSTEAAAKEVRKFLKANGERDFNSDLCFCVFQGHRPGSVGLGRSLYLEPALVLTLRDAALAYRAVVNDDLELKDAAALALKLNVEPGPCVSTDAQVRVVDWGAWAMQYQRRLAAYYLRSLDFIKNQWGLLPPDVADEKQTRDKLLGKLWLVPCLSGEWGDAAQSASAHNLFATRPEVVPIGALHALLLAWGRDFPSGMVTTVDDPKMQRRAAELRWANQFPAGTFLNLESTLSYLGGLYDPKDLVRQMPFSMMTVRWYIRLLNPAPTERNQLLRNLAEYDTAAGRMLADTFPPDQIAAREAAYLKLARQDPEFYRTLFELFKTDDPAKAVNYYEQARANDADAVGLANQAKPVVLYYLSAGNRAKAKEIAEEAAQVGSALGFEALQVYCVRTHDFPRGLQAAQDQEERYGDDGVVLSYIEMLRKEQPGCHDFDKLYAQKLAQFNPAALPDFKPTAAPPVTGVMLRQAGQALRPGDIVVAVDGKAVQNARQLRALRRYYSRKTGDEQHVPMVVFRAGRYLELQDTTAGLSVSDYHRSGGGIGAAPQALAPASPVPSVAPAPAPAAGPAEPAYLRQLRLNGLSGPASHRLAIINGKTLGPGESASVNLDGKSVSIRCLSIGSRSVSVLAEGASAPRELFLTDGQ